MIQYCLLAKESGGWRAGKACWIFSALIRHENGRNKRDATIDGNMQRGRLWRRSGFRLIRRKINIADMAVMLMLARPIRSRVRYPQRLCGEEDGK